MNERRFAVREANFGVYSSIMVNGFSIGRADNFIHPTASHFG